MYVENGLITPLAAGNLFVGCMVSGLRTDKVWRLLVPLLPKINVCQAGKNRS